MEIFIFSYFVFLLMSLHKAIKYKSKWWFVIGLTPIINIEHFNWGYTIGLFLIICGFIVTISYNELNSIDHHYNERYNKALEDMNKMLDNKNHE